MSVRDEIDQLVDLANELVEPLSLLVQGAVPFPSELTQALGEALSRVGEALIGNEPLTELVQQPRTYHALSD